MSKHTPGEWMDGTEKRGHACVISENGVKVADLSYSDLSAEYDDHGNRLDNELAANIRIIAKVPALLTAVESLASLLFDATNFRDEGITELLQDIEYGENNPFKKATALAAQEIPAARNEKNVDRMIDVMKALRARAGSALGQLRHHGTGGGTVSPAIVTRLEDTTRGAAKSVDAFAREVDRICNG